MNLTELERKGLEHDIYAKLNLGAPLNKKERSYYLLYIATPEQVKEYLRKEKAVKNYE